MSVFSPGEQDYLTGQPLGRLATLDTDGAPQARPVGFAYDPERGTIDIGGRNLPASRKYRNILTDSRVSFVVDDLASTDPWRPRGVEIRGLAEALPEHIRIHPRRVLARGIDSEPFAAPHARSVTDNGHAPEVSAVTLVNAFTVPVAESEAFLERWRDNAAAMARQPGFRNARMLQALHDNAELRFVNIAEWDSEDALRAAQATDEFHDSVRRVVADPALHVTPRPATYRAAERIHPTR